MAPGLTGLAQANGRNSLKWEEKFAYDIKYVNNISLCADIMIVFKTVYKVFKREDIVNQTNDVILNFDDYRKQQQEEEHVH